MYLFLILGFLCVLPQNYCETSTTQDDSFRPYEGNRYDSFDWEILKTLETSAENTGNVIISSLSVKLLLAILNEGIPQDTSSAMELRGVLGFPRNLTEMRSRFSEILSVTQSQKKSYDLNIASKIYVDEQFNIREEYSNNVEKYYQCLPEKVPFSKVDKTVDYINDWVKNATAGQIHELVTPDDFDQTVMILLNAIYFRGQWSEQFPKNQTTKAGFYLSNSKTVTVDYMQNTGKYLYHESNKLDAKVLRLPYRDSNISMYILLPNTKTGLKRLIRDVTGSYVKQFSFLMDEVNIQVSLPKFKFEYKSQYKELLQKMGLTNIFQNTASFDNMYVKGQPSKSGQGRPFVSNILQKAAIDVDEEGSTVAAATELVLSNKFGTPDFIFNASNPFLFFIEDESKGAILFTGKVENPANSQPMKFPTDLTFSDRFGNPQDGKKQMEGGHHESAMGLAVMNKNNSAYLFLTSLIYLFLFS